MDTVLRFAQKKEEIALKQLFLNCFDDTLGFVNMFFSHHFIPENTVVAEAGGRPIGLLFLLPCSQGGERCYYIYGVCVAPGERGRGIGSRLLSFAVETAKKRGAKVILKPENESLFSFYEKAGFLPCAYYKEEFFEGGIPAKLLDISPEEYCDIRSRALFADNPILWDTDATEYALSHETFFGGRAYKYTFENEVGIALFTRDGGKTVLKETSARGSALAAVAAAGDKIFGGDGVYALIPTDRSGTPYAYGIGFENPVYLGLMLD